MGESRRGGRGLIPALGIAQICSWGTLFYSIAVLGESLRAELGIEKPLLFGFYTAGLIVSALLAPVSGRRIDRVGGRVVLSQGSILAAGAMLLLATSRGPVSLGAAYLLAGAAMSMCLYDPAFATLHRLRPDTYRRAVTLLTLFGGLASTFFWPIAEVLNERLGWRGAFAVFAGVHLLVCLPIHCFALPREAPHAAHAQAEAAPARPRATSTFYWLAASFALASLLFGSFSAHLIEMLKGQGMSAANAVLVGACIGPMQVSGRILELAVAKRTRAIHVGIACFTLLACSMALLAMVGSSVAIGIAFAMVYGMGNGILTIVRGIAPAELLGGQGMGALLGRLARVHLPAAAIAPFAFALLRESGIGHAGLVGLCALVALAAGACFLVAATRAR